MIASKDWGPCFCNCGKNISRGDEFLVVNGGMYLRGHEERATREIPAIKHKRPKQDRTMDGLPLFDIES